MKPLTLGFSPCPNDTFIFHALAHGMIDLGELSFAPQLEDVESLNRQAIAGRLDITKVSYGALPHLLDEYILLRSGGALGRGCGPLLVAREQLPLSALRGRPIAIPGRYTTANLLLRLFEPDAPPGLEMPYDRILPAVASGEVAAGLIIHESRFTYQEHGLIQLLDLGEWWERATGSPIPLGAIVARRDLGPLIPRIEKAIRESIEYAFAHPDASAEYVRRHSQELSAQVTQSHIDLYVNNFSVDLGVEGESAVVELLDRASRSGLLPATAMDPFRRDVSG